MDIGCIFSVMKRKSFRSLHQYSLLMARCMPHVQSPSSSLAQMTQTLFPQPQSSTDPSPREHHKQSSMDCLAHRGRTTEPLYPAPTPLPPLPPRKSFTKLAGMRSPQESGAPLEARASLLGVHSQFPSHRLSSPSSPSSSSESSHSSSESSRE